MTVARALDLAPLRHALPEVLAGGEHLETPIRWVHSSEVDNIADLLRGGELLLTTGMRITSERQGVALIEQLDQRGIAGMVIELGEALPAVPPKMVEAARAARLPLICLHREVAFVDVTEAIHSEIVSHQLSVLQRTEEIHERFMALMMSGGTPQSILEALADMLGNPIVLEDAGGALVYHARYRSSDSDVLSAWERLRVTPSHVRVLSVALPGSRTADGRLVVLALDSELDELAPLAARRAAELVALAWVRANHEQTLALSERGHFLEALAADGLEPRDAATQAARLGFEPAGGLLLPVVASLRAPTGDRASGGDAGGPLWRHIRWELDGAGVQSLTGRASQGAALLLLVAIAGAERRDAVADRVAAIVHRAASRSHADSHALVVGVGGAADWSAAGRELASAWKTASAPRDGAAEGWFDAARPDLDRLLWVLASRDDAQRFVERRIGALLDGSRRGEKLLETLAAFSATSGRVSAAADRLHLGRQALYHRLATIEDLLDADLGDEDTRLGIDLAIRLLAHVEPPVRTSDGAARAHG